MAEERFPEKTEALVAGVVDFAVRLLRTFLALLFAPGRLQSAVRSNFEERRYLYPYAFLLSCAIAQGFIGEMLAKGAELAGIDVLERARELSFSSFLYHSVSVLGIAVLAALLVECVLRGREAEERRQLKDLSYYVIGFFGIGGIVVLLLLSGLLNLTFDHFGSGTRLFVIASSITTVGYVLAILWLLYWLTSSVLRSAPGAALSRSVSARILLIDCVVIVLCVIQFMSPIYRFEEGAPLLGGRLVDLSELKDDTFSMTILLENTSASDLVVNQGEGAMVAAGLGESARLEASGSFCAHGGAEIDVGRFVVLAAGESSVHTVCFRDDRLRELVEGAGYPFVDNRQGGQSLLVHSGEGLSLSVRVLTIVGDRRDGWKRIDL